MSLSLITVGQTKTSYLSAGDKAFSKEDYSAALGFYLQSLEFDADDAYLMMQAGECNRRMFEYKTALAWMNRCQSADKKHLFPEALLYKAETLMCLKEYDLSRSAIALYLAGTPVQNRQRAEELLKRINNAEILSKQQNDTVSLNHCGKNVNTAFSDFAAIYVNDTTLLFSSLRFQTAGAKDKTLASKILTATIDSISIGKSKPMEDVINNPSWHNCNSAVSPDGKLMVFSRCNYNEENKLICSLYESRFLNKNWQEPVRLSDEINVKGFTSTQPSISTAGIEGYILFFVSNKPGGIGEMDIWKSKRDAKGNYAKPENCGKLINTTGNEFSPFYDAANGDLYFSSDSMNGLGGLDIYKLNLNDSEAHTLNLGEPFNSGYNDLYFSLNINKPSTGFLSSNRPGTIELYGQTCCYDIFSFYPQPGKAKETLAVKKIEPIEPLKPVEVLPEITVALARDFLPLKLYFDNDYPDPRSRSSSTNADYESLYQNYFSKLETFIEGFRKAKTKSADDASNAVEQFFASDLQYNHAQLEKFSEQVYGLLENGNLVEISIRGCASPLAESNYNLILSKRRIASMLNYWKKWKEGALQKYIESGNLKISKIPAGESASNNTISDRLDDLANSVYNPIASRERKIEIIRINVSKP